MPVSKRASATDILNALQAQLASWLSFPLDRIKVLVSDGRGREVPKMSAEQDILIELGGFTADEGHRDRHDCRIERHLIVTIRTRANRDESDRDEFWMKDSAQGSIVWEEDVLDALQNFWPENAGLDVLTSSPMRVLLGAKRDKIDGDLAWGEVELTFGLPVRLPLTQGRFP